MREGKTRSAKGCCRKGGCKKPSLPPPLPKPKSDKAGDLNTLIILGTKGYKPWYQEGNYTAHHTNGEGFVDYTDAEVFCETLPDVYVFLHDSGMAATHNMPCPVCKTNHSVFDLSEGMFNVCNSCKSEGWYIGKREMSNGKPKRWWEIWKW